MKRRGWSPTMKSTQKSTTVGTLVYFGPTTDLALKVSIGTIRMADGEVPTTRDWHDTSDVRRNPKIATEIIAYLKMHEIHSVGGSPGVTDCSHEDRNVCGCDDSIYGEDPQDIDDDLILHAIIDAGMELRLVPTATFIEARCAACGGDIRDEPTAATDCLANMAEKMELEQLTGKLEPWFLYFTDPEKPAGQKFLGACIVEARGFISAIDCAHQLGINPGGAVVAYDTPKHDLSFLNRLITSDAEMAQLGYMRRTA